MRRISRNCPAFLIVVVLFAVVGGISAAGERCDIVYANGLDETILGVRVKYSTPYGEPRFSSSRIDLPAGGEYRIGVQGVILPEQMLIDLATKSYVFNDLSGLEPAGRMRIAIEHKEGKPRIRRSDAEGEAEGIERNYLTVANRPNAVDKDSVMQAESCGELAVLLDRQIDEATERQGKLETVDIEAGPVWNQRHAQERCPEVAREWSDQHGREARWTGNWRTTVPGEMSECGCVAGTVDKEGTIFIEDDGWGEATYFPVFWKEWFGVGYVGEQNMTGACLPVVMRFRLPDGDAATMFHELLEDLRIDGYRPVLFRAQAAELDGDGGPAELLDEEIDFRKLGDDKWDAHDRVMEALSAVYARTALRASLAWVENDAFEKAGAGEDIPKTRGVLCSFTKDTFEAVFVPDGSMLLEIPHLVD